MRPERSVETQLAPTHQSRTLSHTFGAWRSLVARGLWVAEVPGSNPGAPIRRHTRRLKTALQPPEPRLEHREDGEGEQADGHESDQPGSERLVMKSGQCAVDPDRAL
jgi:hypothetical protein